MYRKYNFLLLAMLASVVSAAPSSASAWSQTTTESGIPIAWEGSCFYYSINEMGSDDFSLQDLNEITRSSFDVWQDVQCSYFEFIETEPASVDDATFSLTKPNANLLVWREDDADWAYGSTVLALTSVSYDNNTGEILDADIEFNGADNQFANLDTYPPETDLIDLRSTMVHEIGHSVGLDHSEYTDATMFGWDEAGSTDKRDLTDDDIAGLCSIYPVSEDPGSCSEPYCGLGLTPGDTECRSSEGDGAADCNCSAAGAANDSGLIAALLGFFTQK